MSSIEELGHLKIPLDHIKSATENFSDHNVLGMGGFGRVYKGQLPPGGDSGHPGITVAVKRLDVKLSGQGDPEFAKEIVMLDRCKHRNLVSLVGFVDEGNEKIIVYKNEDNGSLDKHVRSENLVWEQRLRICLGAARGLEYLHDGVGTEHRVLHCDIKSSNILLDANWEAKISDFGLSKIGQKDQLYTFVVTMACGTWGYIDPVYERTKVLRKESDVYSFGVVLFEVLCGKLATNMLFSKMVKDHYENGVLNKIIFDGLEAQMKNGSLDIFSNIAFRCLHKVQEQRPTMKFVVKELQSALDHQLGKPISEPERQTGTRTKLWGSETGGKQFSFQLGSNQKLRKITIYYKIFIEGLSFKVQDCSSGYWHDIEYGTLGLPHTAKRFQISLDDDEEIIGLSGSVGVHYHYELVTSLCVMTNKRKYGPFNYEADNHFSGSWDAGLFDGFYGRVGTYIDAVGCCLKATTSTS